MDDKIEGQVRSSIGGDNAWKAISLSDSNVLVECVQGPKEGKTKRISRVDFFEGMVNVEEFSSE